MGFLQQSKCAKIWQINTFRLNGDYYNCAFENGLIKTWNIVSGCERKISFS